MNFKYHAYKAAVGLLPVRPKALRGEGITPDKEAALLSVLRRHRCQGGCFRQFARERDLAAYAFGDARPGVPITQDTCFRLASISKMLTSACCLRMRDEGLLDIDSDVRDVLPFSLRHPMFPERPITLGMLMSHTSGLRDGLSYHQAIEKGAPVTDVLAHSDCYGEGPPGESWEYSNLGAGLIACVLEAITGSSFETLMQRYVFEPLNIMGSFYPQRIAGALADAWRLFPRESKPAFDAIERQSKPLNAPDDPMPLRHYTLAQGNGCLDAIGLERFVQALMAPGFLSAESLSLMRRPRASFGERAKGMRQGLGLFEVTRGGRIVYGHQGNAYGAMHGAFFDEEGERGFLILTTSASLAKKEFLADLIEDLIDFSLGDHHGG